MLFDMTQLTRTLVTLLAVSTLASPAAFADAAAPAAAAPAPAATPGKTTASAGLPRNLNFSLNAGGFFLPGGMEANIDQLNGGAVSLTGGLGFKMYNYSQIENFLTAQIGVYVKPSEVKAGSSHPYVRLRVGLVYAHGLGMENVNLDEGISYRAVSWVGSLGAGYRIAVSDRVNISLGAGAFYSGLQSADIGNYSGFLPNAEFALGFAF